MGAPDSEGVPRHSSPVRPSFGSGPGLGPGCGLAASAHAGPRPGLGPGQGRTHSDCDPSPGTLQNEVLLRLRAQTSFRLGLGLLLASPPQSGGHLPASSGIGQRPTYTAPATDCPRQRRPSRHRSRACQWTLLLPAHWRHLHPLAALPLEGRHSRVTVGAEGEGAAGSTLVRPRLRIMHHLRTQVGMRDRSARSPMPTYDMCSGWWWIEATKKPLPVPCGARGAPPPRS